MSTVYDYAKPGTESPDHDKLRVEILASAMSDKSIEDSWWGEDDGILHVQFTNALGSSDEAILDGIVANLSPMPDPSLKGEAVVLVFSSMGEPTDIYIEYGSATSNVTPATMDRKRNIYKAAVAMTGLCSCSVVIVKNGEDVATVVLTNEQSKVGVVDVDVEGGDRIGVRVIGRASSPVVQLFCQGV